MVYPIYNDYSIIKDTKPVLYDINKKTTINFVPMGFDIETSTLYKKDEQGKVLDHFSFMYCWQFSVGRTVLMGRTWEEFSNLLKEIKKYYCHNDAQTIIFIANQSFEFSFMGGELTKLGHNVEVFARTKRKPMKIIIDNTIVFYDTVMLTGYSLKTMAKNYCTTQKMVGDLDYSLVRIKTPLTKKETKYCVNDVLILSEYAQYYAETFLSDKFVPMTSTMTANKVVKDTAIELKTNKSIYWMVKKCYPKNRQEYEYIMSFFSGAYTHGNLQNLFIDHYDVKKYDICSLYPYSLMAFYYPVTPLKRLKNYDQDIIENLIDTKCCLLDVTFHNMKTKKGITTISKNKIIDDKKRLNDTKDNFYTFDNGRLWWGKKVNIRITEVDLQLINMIYNYDKVVYNTVIYADRGKLPPYYALSIAKLYKDKCILKHDKSKKLEYAQAKSKLNGQYGALCTKLNFVNNIYKDGHWDLDDNNVNFETMSTKKKTLPQWAIWTTSHSRFVTISNIVKIKPEDFYYSDTDSIVCANKPYIIKLFDKYNKECREKNKSWIDHYNLDPNIDYAEMGTFDDETKDKPIVRFKTLGSKRYISQYENGQIEVTVAGLPKRAFNKYCSDKHLKPFEVFNNDMILDSYYSEKLCAYYCDEEVTKEVTDYRGATYKITAASYVSLIPTSFQLTVTQSLQLLWDRFKEDNYNV